MAAPGTRVACMRAAAAAAMERRPLSTERKNGKGGVLLLDTRTAGQLHKQCHPSPARPLLLLPLVPLPQWLLTPLLLLPRASRLRWRRPAQRRAGGSAIRHPRPPFPEVIGALPFPPAFSGTPERELAAAPRPPDARSGPPYEPAFPARLALRST
eukprot:161704-Chlamydomonas_euryale.AAC.10